MAIDGGDSCRGGIIDNIKLGLYKHFRFTAKQKILLNMDLEKAGHAAHASLPCLVYMTILCHLCPKDPNVLTWFM